MTPAPRFDDGRIHLQLLDEEHVVHVRVRVGPTPVDSVVGLARAVEDDLRALALQRAASEGRHVSCREGCAHCCRQLVPVSPLEANRLAEVLAGMPIEQRDPILARFGEAVKRMESLGLVGSAQPPPRVELRARAGADSAWDEVSRRYFEARIDCPFLVDERCGIYDERPLPCREYMVTSPVEACRTLGPEVRAVERLAWGSEVLADAANAVLGRTDPLVPLPLALEWASARAREYEKVVDGEDLFHAFSAALAGEPPPARQEAAGARAVPPRRRGRKRRRRG